MADYEDPVRWEVAAQTRTLLSSNASLLESVASSKLIGGGRRPVKLGEFSSTLRPTEEVVGGSSQSGFLHHGSAASAVQGTIAYSSSAPSLRPGSQEKSAHGSTSSVRPYQSLVGQDQRASEYAFTDKIVTTVRPPSARTISRLPKTCRASFERDMLEWKVMRPIATIKCNVMNEMPPLQS